ncbi:hypothetical protein [Alkaliphilus hydrothermalis]|uniref:ABC-transporter type IV n=1 Tax=Alkaliphilus hydrothermalis TaxID=1482730 RepID=A0ABS2NR61_9FIRM|nr:hypothetical protein [Alkaliphilus hydrothermalis]MBM7615415.1 hypothetical protein [Alkaliphilus hydrothermalis]
MDQMPLKDIIICGIPEAMIMIYLGLYLMGKKPSVKRVVVAGILQGIASYYIRQYTGYGERFVYQTISMMAITCSVVRVNPLCGLVSSSIGATLNILVESAYILMALKFSDYTYAEILSHDWLRVIFATPKQIILLLIMGVIIKNRYTLEAEFKFLGKIKG